MCLSSILKDFRVNKKKKKDLNGYVYGFSIDDNTIDISDIWDIHWDFMRKHDMI